MTEKRSVLDCVSWWAQGAITGIIVWASYSLFCVWLGIPKEFFMATWAYVTLIGGTIVIVYIHLKPKG